MANQTYFKVLQAAKQTVEAQHRSFDDLMYVFLARQNWTQTNYLVRQQQIMPIAEQIRLKQDLALILQDVPPQYIVHQAWFYGRSFYVDERVLIPQYDTETLLDWVLGDYQKPQQLSILDIGTGSGILAATLKLERPDWQVTATDISKDALVVARKNATALQANVTFLKGDLWAPIQDQRFDLIVSNPPYIAESERSVMDQSVLKYEPEIALFAQNSGLAFYQDFALAVKQHLKPKGRFYLEFGYQQKQALQRIFQELVPQVDLAFHQDLAGHDRVLRGASKL